ncbi:MAG TPA: FtsX-like permease family protein, partial [Chitinophagaceae bacterium]|nr:FtsX-like permease family protein [Chitinophagaceae bacterium]
KDFHYNSLRDKIGPLAIFPNGFPSYISLRFEARDIAGLVKQLEQNWKSLAAGQPFSWNFLDEKFALLYNNENRVARITDIFTIIAILIACMGLLGLVTFIAEQRTKEIGIRKLLGASVFSITQLLARNFVLLVGISLFAAFPVAGYLMQRWLNDFAYRIKMEWWMFAVVGAAALLVALLTVSFRAVKSAMANPVKSLRTE